MKIVLTGANRGLGIHLARTALERGHTVLAGVRTVAEDAPINRLKNNIQTEFIPIFSMLQTKILLQKPLN